MSTDIRFVQNRGFIQQTIDPVNYNTRPPAIQHPTAVYKKIDAELTYTIGPQVPAPVTNYQIPNGRGLILWFPKLGVDSIYHMGIIPKGAQSFRQGTGATFTANSLTNSLRVDSATTTNWNSGIWAFNFTRALALPRFDVPIKLAPVLGINFSRSRLYGGALKVWSNTISIGNTALNGSLTTSVISDTRDVAQNEAGDDCFSVVDQAQSARTEKECVKEVDANIGVVNVQGPDFGAEYRAPEAINDVREEGGWATPVSFPVTRRNGLNFAATMGAPSYNQWPVFSAWYSPWGVDQEEGVNAALASTNYLGGGGIRPAEPAITTGPISEMGVFDVKFQARFRLENLAGADLATVAPTRDLTVVSIVEHVFAGVRDSATGITQINILRTTNATSRPFTAWQYKANSDTQWQRSWALDIGHYSNIQDEFIAQGGMQNFGKCIGVKVSILMSALPITLTGDVVVDSLRPYVPVTFSNQATWVEQTSGPKISFFARDINIVGQCGPAHIIRYDNIGAGQNLRISGVLNTESVAKGNLAPYLQGAVGNTSMSPDANVLPLVWMLYNGISPFKCSWEASDYDRFRDEFVKNLTPESLAALADNDTRIHSASSAAGLFSSIGGAIGGIGDAIFGASGQFGTGGQSSTNLGAQFGAGGQFGASGGFNANPFAVASARGQFGSSGQYGYGSASGSMSGTRRMRD